MAKRCGAVRHPDTQAVAKPVDTTTAKFENLLVWHLQTSSAFVQDRELVVAIQVASVGALQLSLGTTRPPSSSIAAFMALKTC